MTGRPNPSLDALRDERDHVMILLNLMENSDSPDGTRLDHLRDRLSQLERHVNATMREMDSPSSRRSQADRRQCGGDPQVVAPNA